ncbi:MAG: alpha/beta fold hydrolase [bacterium]
MTLQPFHTDYLEEKDGHKVWFAQYGNSRGITIVVCHGGPGGESKPKHVTRYDLSKYQVITFDQRGCGQSLPLGETKNNTLADLVADMERLRSLLKIDKWYVAGGSWGSTLSLAYAEAHPDKVLGLLLSSIFLGRRQDVDWSFTKSGGVEKIFTDLWQTRQEFLAKFGTGYASAASDLLSKMNSGDQIVVAEITAGVMNWENNLMSSQSDLTFTDPSDVKAENIASVKIFLHYDSHDSFMTENQLLANIDLIKDIPTIIVHGRYDLLCTFDQAWELHEHLPQSEIIILPSSNHRLTADGEIAKNMAFKYFLTKQNL